MNAPKPSSAPKKDVTVVMLNVEAMEKPKIKRQGVVNKKIEKGSDKIKKAMKKSQKGAAEAVAQHAMAQFDSDEEEEEEEEEEKTGGGGIEFMDELEEDQEDEEADEVQSSSLQAALKSKFGSTGLGRSSS